MAPSILPTPSLAINSKLASSRDLWPLDLCIHIQRHADFLFCADRQPTALDLIASVIVAVFQDPLGSFDFRC